MHDPICIIETVMHGDIHQLRLLTVRKQDAYHLIWWIGHWLKSGSELNPCMVIGLEDGSIAKRFSTQSWGKVAWLASRGIIEDPEGGLVRGAHIDQVLVKLGPPSGDLAITDQAHGQSYCKYNSNRDNDQ